MLLSIPVVLILAVSFFETRDDPYRLAFGLSVLFVFLGVVLIRAFLDISALTRQHLAERRQNFKETIGDESFLEGLRGSGEDDGGAADSGEG
ncbi:MAG: hypothetical protein KF886_26665 [Candidatus Hydrogenedentes bacterium]|jgi:hypothetical protein|nr:hypothetical protein [Candidatus Hydrogenedentota bacterium]